MKSNIILSFFFLCCFPVISQASAYWMEVKGTGKVNEPVQIQICYGYIDDFSIRHRDTGPELALTGAFRLSVVDENGKVTIIPIQQKADCWEGAFTPTKNGNYRILGINDTHPVVDRSKSGGKNVRPVDYLCTAYNVGNSATLLKPVQFLDITTGEKAGLTTVKAYNNQQTAVVKTKLRVFNTENWEKELEVDEHGEAAFKTTMRGLYIIREDWVDPTPGTYKDVAYTSIRYRCNYCLLVQ